MLPLTHTQLKIPNEGYWGIVKHHKITEVIGWVLVQSNEAVFVYLFPCTAFSEVCQHLHDMNASVLIKVNESETGP